MKLINRILALLLLMILVFCLVSCAECISTEYESVEVTVTDAFHRAMWVQPVWTGKVMMTVVHPAIYRITVKYKGVEYTIGDQDTYKKYKDKIGQTVVGKVEIKTYDDGTVKYDIVSLE